MEVTDTMLFEDAEEMLFMRQICFTNFRSRTGGSGIYKKKSTSLTL